MSEKKKIILHPDHPKPISRRDFLRAGIIPFAASMIAPSLLTQLLWENKARAGVAQCADGASANLIPFLVFDMAGGMGLPGNFLVGKKGGPEDLLSSYDSLGWDPRAGGAIDKSFGLPMAAKVSQLLAGIKQTSSPKAQANLRMGSFCNFSRDDSSDNQLSALTLVSKAGLRGSFLPNGLGTRSSVSGGNSIDPLSDLTLKPMNVSTVDDVAGALSYGPAFNDFTDDEIKAFGKVIHNMSAEQVARFNQMNMGNQMAALSECAYGKNMQYGKNISGVDPRAEVDFQKIYNINANTQINDTNAISAAIVMNVLKNNSGPGCITIGECDYHNKGQNFTDQKDREAGQQIGRAIEAAYRLKKPLIFQLLTDGGVYANPGTREWQGDSSTRSMTIIGFYNPNGAPKQRRLQVGSYVDGQAVDQTTVIGGEPAKVAYAVLANYLSAQNAVGNFDNVAPRSLFSIDQLDSILIFG